MGKIKNATTVILTSLIAAWIIYAAWTYTELNSGQAITEENWNAVIAKLNSINTASWSVPSWAVMAFWLNSCPSWWSPADWKDWRLDLRWQFLRWLNDFGTWARSDGNQDPEWWSRTIWSYQWDAIRNITGSFFIRRIWFNNNISVSSSWVFSSANASDSYTRDALATTDAIVNTQVLDMDVSRQVPIAPENRPKNVWVIYCMKN